jgi:TonB-linked SusC/RagA family outer membrane protein
MFVIDGVVLADVDGTTIDLESLDIESVEVVKGAAAASLYGSRAASGVISITTSRGRGLALDQTRITARSEFGFEEAPKGIPLSNSHQFLQNDQGQWLDRNGNVVDRSLRVVDSDNIMDNPYRTQVYDNISSYFRPGQFTTNTVNLSYFGAATNFLTSASFYRQRGPLEASDGFNRLNFRVNLDHRLRDDFSLSVSAAHSRYKQDQLAANLGEGGIFWDLMLLPPDMDLSRRDSTGQYIHQPDPTILLENPLWVEATRDETEWRVRTLASVDARFNAFSWLNLAGNVAYDRSDQQYEFYIPKGTPTSLTADVPSDGRLDKDFDYADAINASLTSNILWNFGGLSTRTTLRGSLEREKSVSLDTRGDDFWVVGVPSLDVAATAEDLESDLEEIRSTGYFLEENLDYDGKYIGSFLVRRDGSSLFGPEDRWQTYYRAAGSWRLSQESWWPFEKLTEFKLRASIGTAGGRPGFNAQYETWAVATNGAVTKNTLGNRELKPSRTTEHEFGIDLIALDRYSLELTYARQKTKDQIIQLALPAMVGYPTQWFNTGLQSGHTFEATFQAQIANRRNFTWNATLVADRSRSRIDEWNRSCFFDGLQNICEGAGLSEIWGERFLTSLGEISAKHQAAGGQFQVNDDGYVVWVGPGNTYEEGLSKNLWGTSTVIDGVTYNWGLPIIAVDSLGFPIQQLIGHSDPDVNVGWLNNLTFRGLAIHTHLHAQIGGNVYNGTRQRLHQHERHGDLDQAGKPAERKKTITYYQTLYNANNNTTHFVEPGGYLKLRAISLQYRFNRDQLRSIGLGGLASQLSLGLIGRNIFTITNYSGFDPEVGTVLERRDTFAYPNGRQFTATVEITF